MFKTIVEIYKNFEKITNTIMNKGLKFCVFLCLISVLILLTYNYFFASPNMYYIGISLFRLSIIFGIEFVVCGFVVDGIKKELV